MIGLGDAMAVGQDMATAACGGFNCLYFFCYALRQPETVRRRIGAAALALVNGGVVVESLYLFALYLSLRLGLHSRTELCAPGPWLLARALPFLGTAFVALLVVRSLSRGANGKE